MHGEKTKRMKYIPTQDERLEAEQRTIIEQENIHNWSRMEFETLNTQMMEYKKTQDDQLFMLMWHDQLKKLTNQYLHDFIIKGLPEMARRLFLTDTKAEELQDMLYPVLIQAIHDWEPDAEHRFTKDFTAFYKKAVEYERANILRKFNSKCNKQVSLQNLDFNSNEEVNHLIMNEPKLARHLRDQFCLEQVMMKWHMADFVQTCLTPEEMELFQMFYKEQRTVMEIAQAFKVTRMTIYRRMEKVKRLWAKFDQDTYLS